MKKLLLLLILGCWGTSAYSQNINVVSTNPANGAFNVDQDSIVLIFDAPIEFDVNDPNSSGFSFVVEPEDSISYTSISISDDSLKVTAYVNLADNTDYFGILLGVQGKNGETLQTPYVFQFTTADEAGPYTVSGKLDEDYLDTHDNYNGMVMTLSAIPFELDMDMDMEEDDNTDEPTEENEDFVPVYVASVNTTTGEYSVSGVREGTYYPLALNAFEIEAAENDNEMNEEFFFPDIFIYDPNEDLSADEITVDDSSTTNNVLSGINLRFLDFSPLLFSEALEIIQNALENFENDPVIMGGSSSYYYMYYDDSEGPAFSKFKIPEIRLTAEQKAPFQGVDQSKHSKFKNFADSPDGTNLFWEVYAYDAVKDSAIGFIVLPFGQIPMGYFSEEDVELEVEFETIKPLPANILDSDEVITIAETNGGLEFRETYSSPQANSYSGVDIDLSSLHEYWTYTPNPTPEAPQFWKVSYYGYSYDFDAEEYQEDSLLVFMDISTGEVLLPTTIEPGSDIPAKISLNQNYPNPFNPATNISFTLNKNAIVELNVFNLLGQKVATLINEVYPAGVHSIQWDAQNMASGVYLYRLNAGGVTQTRKMLLMK